MTNNLIILNNYQNASDMCQKRVEEYNNEIVPFQTMDNLEILSVLKSLNRRNQKDRGEKNCVHREADYLLIYRRVEDFSSEAFENVCTLIGYFPHIQQKAYLIPLDKQHYANFVPALSESEYVVNYRRQGFSKQDATIKAKQSVETLYQKALAYGTEWWFDKIAIELFYENNGLTQFQSSFRLYNDEKIEDCFETIRYLTLSLIEKVSKGKITPLLT